MFDEILQQSPDNSNNQQSIEQKDSKLVQEYIEPTPKQPEGGIKVEQLPKIGKKIKSKLLFLVIIAISLIILGGGYFYYAKGEALLLSKNMEWRWGNETENYYTKSSLFLKIKNIDLKNQSSNVFLMTDSIPESLQLNFNSNIKSIEKNGEGFLALELDIGSKLDLDLDFKKIDQNLYLKPKIIGLSEIIPFISISDIDLEDEWILLEIDDQNIPLYGFSKAGPDSLEEVLNEKIPIFLDNLKKENIFSIEEPHENKILEGAKLKKVGYFIKESKMDDFIFLSIDTFSEDEDRAYETKKEFIESKTKKPEEWKNIKNFIQNLKISLWIDKQNKIIKGIDFNLNNFEVDTKDFAADIDLEFSNLMDDIEKTEILAPNNHISMEDFLQSMQDSFGLNLNTSIKESAELIDGENFNNKDSDGDGLTDYIEQIIGTDINKKDTDGDTYLDLEEIVAGYDPLSDGKLELEILDAYIKLIEDNKLNNNVNNIDN